MISRLFNISANGRELLIDIICSDNEYIFGLEVWNFNKDNEKLSIALGETQSITVAGKTYNVVSRLTHQMNIQDSGLTTSLIVGGLSLVNGITGVEQEVILAVVNPRSAYIVTPKKVLEIYQGESAAWWGYLIDDDGTVITDLSSYNIEIALKSDLGKIALKWNVSDIILGDDGHFVITLPSTKTRRLKMGEYMIECAISRGGDTAVIAELKSVIKIKSSALKGGEQ